MDKYIGKKLEGRYEILELIGFGGMAIVFKAYDIKENKHVAIKILKDEYLSNDDFKRRFRNESKAIAVLSHPSIVKVFDVNFSDNIQYIVMEYIDGITLKEYIEQQGTVKWKEAVHFTVQILRALQHAHDNGIVHRDVKPQNVMLLQDGTIKVMDFGIARFARENGKTMSDKAIGSVHYISPEQAKGDITDEKTDIYATGVIMYEMLTGKVPFDGDSAVSIAIKQMQIDPERPRVINEEIPTGLEEIILRAMQKDPHLRYQTASEMLKDIDEFKQNPSVVFEYKYFNSDGTTKYFDKIESKKTGKSDEQVKKSYTMNILAGVAAACVLVMVAALFIFLKGLKAKKEVVTVEDIVGITVQEAEKRMPKLVINTVETVQSQEFEKGIIIEQRTNAGMKEKAGAKIDVVVSSGLQSIVMPDLTNETLTSAKTKLEGLGLEVEAVQMIDEKVTLAHVIKTDPAADAEVKKGDKVTVYVSKGSAQLPAEVPDLIGLTEAEARAKLSGKGLRTGTVKLVDSDKPLGQVVNQTPGKDAKLAKGDAVDLEISNGAVTKKTVNITVNFPKGESVEQNFELYVNGQLVDHKVINPGLNSSMTFSLTSEKGKIKGGVDELSVNEVRILVDGSTFASYTVDFKAENQPVVVDKPNFDLIFPFGYGDNSSHNSSNGNSDRDDD